MTGERSNILFSENALMKIREAFELIAQIDGELNATTKANLRQIREYAITIINVVTRKL